MKKRYIFLIAFVLLLAAAALTNPSPEAYKERLKKEVREFLADAKNLKDSPLSGMSGFLASTAIDLGFDQSVEVDNYFFFGIARVRLLSMNQRVAIGIFGGVHLFRSLKDVVKDAGSQLGL
jgi:hypothetical protein